MPRSEPKSELTRRRLLDRALVLFRKHGVDGTTMRDIARAAKMSLGAAYYYFPSKEALVFAHYDAHQDAMDALAPTGTLRERLGQLFHAKLRLSRDDRPLLVSILPRLIDPGDPLSAFSAQTSALRERSIAQLAAQLADLPPEPRALAANALWIAQLGAMLLFVRDDTPDQRRTHQLVDDGLDLAVPLLPFIQHLKITDNIRSLLALD